MLRKRIQYAILSLDVYFTGVIFTDTVRASKAKDRIADALVELIEIKNIEDITVAELVEKAGVSKSSFYRNYHDIYDVFEYLSNDFVNRVCGVMLTLVFEYSPADFKDMPDSIDYRTIMTVFGLRDSDMVLVNYLFSVKDSKVFRSVVKLFVETVGNYARENNLNIDAVEYCTRFVANGIYYSALTDYFDKGKFDTSLFNLLKLFDILELK